MPPDQKRHCLVLGAYGAVGSAIALRLEEDGCSVRRGSRADRPDDATSVNTGEPSSLRTVGLDLPSFDAVVWAQGTNTADSAAVHASDFGQVMEANVATVARTLAELVELELLAPGARLVVVSSIWERLARKDKFSYTVSKAALGGLVRAAAADLASRGILINGVLPGVLDTPMTRAALSEDQIALITEQTPGGRLVTPSDVAALVSFLCSPANTALTGQSLTIDLGFSLVRAL